jgi:hypothetical protein
MIKSLFKHKFAYFNSLRTYIKISNIDPQKEKEIIVWIRLQKGLDKPETLDFIQKKFKLDANYAETLFYKALPDGLSHQEFEKIEELSTLAISNNISPNEVAEVIDSAISPENYTKNISQILDIIEYDLGNHPKIYVM